MIVVSTNSVACPEGMPADSLIVLWHSKRVK